MSVPIDVDTTQGTSQKAPISLLVSNAGAASEEEETERQKQERKQERKQEEGRG